MRPFSSFRVVGKRLIHNCLVAMAACFTVGLSIAQPPAPSLWITSAGAVHNLSREQAARRYPVHLTATVLQYDHAIRSFFVQDETGAVYVASQRLEGVHAGDLVSITGVTQPSFSGNLETTQPVQVIGHGTLPKPVQLYDRDVEAMMKGRWECRLVTLHGTVRTALRETNGSDRLSLEMLMGGIVIPVSIPDASGIDTASLIDSEVEVTGLLAVNFTAKFAFVSPMLRALRPADLKLVRRSKTGQGMRMATTSVDELARTRTTLEVGKRIHLHGSVTYYRPGQSIVVQQDGRSISGQTRQRGDLPLGSVVDLTGYVYQDDSGPVLKQVMFHATGKVAEVPATPVTFADAMTGVYSDEPVKLRGRVLSQSRSSRGADMLSLAVDGHDVEVTLLNQPGGIALQPLRPGSLVEVTGICRVTLLIEPDLPLNNVAWFRIELRSVKDVALLKGPSWWTMDNLIKLLTGVCVLVLLLGLWLVVLRRRVKQQTRKLEGSMFLEKERSRILQAISSDTPLRQLLDDLCATCDALMPGVRCGCRIAPDLRPGETSLVAGAEFDEEQDRPLYEARLDDGRGGLLGHFRASPAPRTMTPAERETFDVFAGLATLALNQRRMYQELNYTSTHDQLTGLPNRRLADTCLERALQQRSRGAVVAVVYIDVDHFKQVNDRHGHKTGDSYLQLIAARMRGAVRGTDTLARIGGDEFLLVASGLHDAEEAERYRARLKACFAEPFLIDGTSIDGSASIGIAVSPDHGTRPEELKRKADMDMYAAKHHHRTGTDMRTVAAERESYTAADLETALHEKRFQLFYQPQFCTDGRLRGLEALLRLSDPSHGLIAPDAFIGVAERNDVIHPLGAWVLREALADAVRWSLPARNARMMVNISIRQAEHPAFADSVMRIIREAGIAPGFVELEITERMLMSDMPQAIAQLTRLRLEGVHIAIDDFGVEHSSLSVLHNLPFDTLKLDRTFIRAMHEDREARHIVRAIVDMAQNLGKRVVAEGVETKAHVQALAPFCDVDLQGYYFSRPRPAEEIAHALTVWSGDVSEARAAAPEAPVMSNSPR